MKKHRITIVAYYFGKKLGAGSFMENLYPPLMKRLQENNYEITLITNSYFMRDCGDKLPADIQIHRPKLLEKSVLSKFYFLFLFGNTPYVQQADCVLFSIDSIIGWKMNNVIAIIHDLNEFAMQDKLGKYRTWFRKRMIENTITKARKIIVISHFVKQQIKTYLPKLSAGKDIEVIHSGAVLPNNLDNVLDDREPFFVVVGRIDPKAKYLYEAVRVFLAYQKNHPEFRLKIAGEANDFCRQDAAAFLQYINDIPGIDYVGHVSNEELDLLYRKATATLFLSKLEGFGLPVLESFARGCPVITNGNNEVNDELTSGMDIKIYDDEIENEAVINEKINKINQIDRNKLIAVAASFSWEKTAEKYMKILK
ncbi:hypothetical protein AGMMS50262_14060 [Bacteroidia bacterium]|nr:hypothetical protein AGMMS50262_14060 [Bacteroidia bacterium]